MNQTAITLAIAIALVTFSSLVNGDCTIRDPLVGIGYHLIYGNPDGDDDLAGRDPGLKYNRKILDITYDEGKSATVNSIELCVPDQATTVPLTSCSYTEETYFFSGTASYQEIFSSMVSVDSSYDNGLSSFEFSLSSEYESVEEASETTESVFFDKRAFCHESQSRYQIENIPNEDNHGVSTSFYYAFNSLPDVSQDTISDDDLEEYYDFLGAWGTHILDESDLGGRRVERYESTLTDLYEYALETSATSVSLGGEYNGFSTSVSVDVSSLSESTSSSTEFGESYKTITTGAKLEYADDQWQIPSGDDSSPEPTQLHLISIATVCDDEGYWSTITDLSDVTTFLSNRCDNLKNAISDYSTYLQLTAASDLSSLPIVWPNGYYGLLKPTDGCPSDTDGFSFQTGWRKQKPYNNKKHRYSDDHHFEGTLKGKKATYNFCMKNVEEANSLYSQTWPAGQYCIFKSSKGDCPDDFSEGYIKWRDQKRGNSKSNDNVPAGKYGKSKTTIYYCCREDGSADEDIYLPTADPFYLIRKGDSCQKVSGMTVTEESMRLRSKKKGNKNAGTVPYISGKPYRLYYCYYAVEE